jgi:uncharacterized protein (DUF4415 family)
MKKSSASSRPGKLIRKSAESIWSKPLTQRQKATLDAVSKRQKRAEPSGKPLSRQGAEIDYADIPRLTDKQLAQFSRPRKKLVAVRLDSDVYEWLRKYGEGYSTRINQVLRVVMSRER